MRKKVRKKVNPSVKKKKANYHVGVGVVLFIVFLVTVLNQQVGQLINALPTSTWPPMPTGTPNAEIGEVPIFEKLPSEALKVGEGQDVTIELDILDMFSLEPVTATVTVIVSLDGNDTPSRYENITHLSVTTKSGAVVFLRAEASGYKTEDAVLRPVLISRSVMTGTLGLMPKQAMITPTNR